MIGRKLLQAGQVVRRNISTSAPRRGHHEHEPTNVIGANLPFSIENPWTLAVKFALFFGSGFAAPFLMVRHQLLQKRG